MKPADHHIALAWARYSLAHIARSNNLADIHALAKLGLDDTDTAAAIPPPASRNWVVSFSSYQIAGADSPAVPARFGPFPTEEQADAFLRSVSDSGINYGYPSVGLDLAPEADPRIGTNHTPPPPPMRVVGS